MSDDENRWPEAATVLVMAAVRGEHAERVVARVQLVDALGDHRHIDMSPTVAMDLLRQLANFLSQIGVE